MDNVYQLNTHPISGMPMKPAEHKRSMIVLLCVVIAIGVIVGVWFWISQSMDHSAATQSAMSRQDMLRARVAALLESAPSGASQAQVSKVTALLQSSNTGKLVPIGRTEVAHLLTSQN